MSDPQWETMSDQQRFERLKEQVDRLKTQVQNLDVKNEALFHRLRDAEEKISYFQPYFSTAILEKSS